MGSGEVIKRLIGAAVVALCFGGTAVSAAASPTTTPPAGPVPAPAPTQQPTGLGDDEAMNVYALACFIGSMQACDTLYNQSPLGSAYETYGDTCAGRRPAGTLPFCTDVFTDAVGQQTTATTTSPPATTTSPSATEASPTSSSVAVPLTTLSVVATSSVVASSQSTLPSNPDNDHLFTSGEIEIPPGEVGQLSVVHGNTTDAGDLMIVVRNGRNEAVPGVLVAVNGFDDSGELTFNVIVPIEMVLGPDEWAFGHAQAVNLDQTTDFNVEFFDPGEIGEPVNLEVTDAEFQDGVITGTIVNASGVPVVDFVSVHVACFNESQIVASQDAAVNTEILRSGESANFTTTAPIDPTTCSSFAIYAGGFPEDETANGQASNSLVVATVPETVAR